MCSAPRRSEDITTRAKIRDAAIAYFGTHGFRKTTVRAIAERAGVSPGLVIHHFGSKDGLREACDAEVTALIDDQTAQASTQLAAADMLAMLASRPDFSFLAAYITTALIEGGQFGERLMARLIDDMEAYLRSAVAAGIARPTDDERARAELITLTKLGLLTFAPYVAPLGTPDGEVLKAVGDRLTVPALELFTHGLFATSDYLDAVVAEQTRSDETSQKGESA